MLSVACLRFDIIRVVNNGGLQQRYTPEQISATIIKELLKSAEDQIGTQISKAVIGVPVYFNNIQRHATQQAGTIAGLKGVQVINEPVAAALCYARQQFQEINGLKERTILIFDLGGGTFDVSVVKVQLDTAHVVAHGGDPDLGGEDFTQLLVSHIESEILALDVAINKKEKFRLRAQCEIAKCQLSTDEEATIELMNALPKGNDFNTTIQRHIFELLCMDKFKHCLNITRQVVQDACMSVEDIDDIVPIGGSSRIPKLIKLLKQMFAKPIDTDCVDLERAVSYGAALKAGMNDNQNNLNVQDVTALSLGTGENGGIMRAVIPRNTKYPVRMQSQTIVSSTMDQTSMSSSILEGERPLEGGNVYLGRITLDGLPKMPQGDLKVYDIFEVDENGLLKVTRRNDYTGKSISVTIEQFSLNRSATDVQEHLQQAKLMHEEDQRNTQRTRLWVDVHRFAHGIQSRLKYKDLQYKSDMVKDKLREISNRAITWIENNQCASEEKLQAKFKELQQAIQDAL